ncbi:hypothetical protein Halha_1130 [Halobacteroides halobius DSM 5150]|uniref:DUF4258 domain-containing protein n=1 Tax=Halobacteroides halobius (strain ATCC 35273 / DSM 5150 / MD-1) TaxID=748449 RepID=L0K9N1_HALHC|nr:hypothetical protein [Halobacteroides halobius]AGB41079.1 hypothetical protein Halha_1130 [Halobacteroides halobius DSM 5150]
MNYYIYATDHAIERYQQRQKAISRQKAIHNIVEGVKRSRLIGFANGEREIREHRGVIFVCELEGTKMNVITILNSKAELRFVEDNKSI